LMAFFPLEDPKLPKKAGQDKPRPIIPIDLVTNRPIEEFPSQENGRINLKGLVVLCVVVLLSPIFYLALTTYQDGRLHRMAMEQAKQAAAKGDIDKAILILSRYLESWPEDIPGLELMAQLRTAGARTLNELIMAAESQSLLLRVDPLPPKRQDNRRELVKLYIRWSDGIRLISANRNLSIDKTQNRSRTAVKIAEQIIALGSDNAETRRLLAMAQESLAAAGDARALVEATVEYEKALRHDRGDVPSAERLAMIIFEREKSTTGADEVLEELLQAKPDSVEVRLARYRFFTKTNRFDKAQAELDKAIKLAPTSTEVRLICASEAIQHRDPATARRHLNVLPANSQLDRRVLLLRGFVDLSERHPDVAVGAWREGLVSSGGADRELNWRLAYTLIQLGRFVEAEPLMNQYRRLAGEDDPMFHLLKGVRDEMTGRPSAAIAELEKLRASIDKAWHPDISTTLGRCYERINDDARAMLEYRLAIKGSPRLLGAWRALARLMKKSDPESAARELETALVQVPDDPSLLLDLAMIRLEQQIARKPTERSWSKVNEVLDRAARSGKPDSGLLKIRAEMLFSSGGFDEALSLLEKALAGPDRTRDDLWLCLSNGLAVQGRLDEAERVLERGSAPDQAGDHASLRIARANLLLQAGKGRAAREVLTRGVETLPVAERIEVARTRAKILRALGDKASARQACLDWAKLAPREPDAGLELLELSRQHGDDEAARLGLELLRAVGGENEPYALAARALDLLLSNRTMTETRTARLEKATALSQKLMSLAPKLSVARLIRGMIMERSHRIEEAIADYLAAVDGKTAEMALSRLTPLYTKLKRFDDLAALQKKLNPSVGIDQMAAQMAIEQGEKAVAEKLIAGLGEGQADGFRVSAVQARLLHQLGKPEAAEETLRSLLEQAKDQPDPWIDLVMFQASQGASAAVAETIERATAEYHGERPDLLIARLHWVAGNRDVAARLYDQATKLHPEDLLTYQFACGFAEATGQIDRAEALARRALGFRSCSSWAARTLALMLSKRADPASWKEAWALVAPGGPGAGETPGDRLLLASLMTLSPDPARRLEATPALTALIADLPTSNPVAIRARVDLAALLFQAGKPAEAARYIAEATEESLPSDPTNLAIAIELLAKAGKPDEADQRLSRLAAVAPGSLQVTSGRAQILQATGKADEAIQTIEDAASAAEKAPDASAKHAFFFNQLLNMKQPEAAERLARKIARLWPQDACVLADFLATRGRTDEALDACRIATDAGATREPMASALRLVMNGRLDPPQGEKAWAIAQTVVAAQPRNSGLLLQAASIANRQARYDDALKACRRAFEADPSNPLCQNGLNDMAWIFCELLNRPAEALAEVERVLKVEGSATAMDTRGVILTRLGRFNEAIEQLERCVRKEPVGHRFLHLARAYQKAGKVEQYQGALERAKKAGINPAALSPKEREEFAAVIGR
jgi:tetratricopeptide (TPR) repeat protein